MHPLPFLAAQLLSDWPDCRLELHCCKGVTVLPVRMIVDNSGDRPFAEVLSRLRCSRCGKPPAPVYLCAGHREASGGAPADWAIELVPMPR
jgi:hypothetical protein